jgi:hypothetical protein
VAVGAVDSFVDVVLDSVVDVEGSAFAEDVSDSHEKVVVVVGAGEVASDFVDGVEVVDRVEVVDCVEVGDGSEVDGVVVEVGGVAVVVEVVEGVLLGGLVVATVADEGAAVELTVGETGAAVGLGVGWGLVAEGTLEAGAAAGLRAVGTPELGRTVGVVHDWGAMGDPRPVREPAMLNRLTWTWSIWFWVGLPRSSISRQPSAGRSVFQMCCCQMM